MFLSWIFDMTDLRILVVADDPLARAGLAALLAALPGGAVVGQAASIDLSPGSGQIAAPAAKPRPAKTTVARSETGRSELLSGQALLTAVEAHRPDVLLWDMGWNPAPAMERLSQTAESAPPVAVLLPDETYAAEARAAGARALLRRDADPVQIFAALAAIDQGLVVVARDFASALSVPSTPREPSGWSDPDAAPIVEELTARELAVLRLLAEGLPNKTIASRLDISEHTVKFHVNAILGKLGVSSRTEAVVRATRLGLILL
jgi:two-component system, NarL family, nitrate/nitrite response regulator NarL